MPIMNGVKRATHNADSGPVMPIAPRGSPAGRRGNADTRDGDLRHLSGYRDAAFFTFECSIQRIVNKGVTHWDSLDSASASLVSSSICSAVGSSS